MRSLVLVCSLMALSGCGLFSADPDSDVDTSDDSGTDQDNGTDADTDDPNDIVPTNCDASRLELDPLPNAYPDGLGFSVDGFPGGMIVTLNNTATGTFDLAYDNPLDCERCIFLLENELTYAAFRGQVEIVERPTTDTLTLRLIDAEFRQLDDFQPVSDGDCIAMEGSVVVSTESAVIVPSDCPQLTVDTNSLALDGLFGGYFVADVTDPEGEISGELSLEFVSSETGTFSLSEGDNTNLSSCDQCLLIDGDSGVRAFQSSGSIRVDDDPTGSTLDVVLNNIELSEVTLSEGVSTPVPDGRCWSLGNPLPLSVD